MARLEAAKQQNFHKNTLDVWFDEFTRLRWNNEKMEARYRAVLMMPQIRKEITFDDFISAPTISENEIYGDAVRLANRIIENRKKQLKELKISEQEIIKEGLISVEEVYQAELNKKREEYAEQVMTRHKQLRKQMALFGEEGIRKLYLECVKEKLIDRDELFENDWTQLLWYLRNRLLHIESKVEKFIRQLQKGKK